MLRETAETGQIGGFSRFRHPDPVGELATRQHGLVARWQLGCLGVGSDAIDKRLRAGRMYPVYAGVYAVGHRVMTREAWYMAAVLASRPRDATPGSEASRVPGKSEIPHRQMPVAVLSHRSAAGLWRIRPRTDGADHVTLPYKSRSARSIRRHHSPLPADEITTHVGIPVTTVPRTLFDLASRTSADEVEFALREADYLRLFDVLSLRDLIDRYPGSRGVRNARIALDRQAETPSGRARSLFEERFVRVLRHHRLPLPERNAWVDVGGRRHQVDCLWPRARQIVELDGWAGHGTRSAFREDRARDRRLRVAGYSVTRLTWSQLEDEPAQVAADLRSLIEPPAPSASRKERDSEHTLVCDSVQST